MRQTPQSEQAGSWGRGTYGSSRLSLLEIQTLSISCKDTRVGQRRNNLALPCDAHLNIPTPPPRPGIMQGAAKPPSLAMGGRPWHQPWGCSTEEWLHGFAASLEVTGTTFPACLPVTTPRPGTHHSLLLPLELEADVLGPEEAKGADLQLCMKLLPAPGDGQATCQPSVGTGGTPGSVSQAGAGDQGCSLPFEHQLQHPQLDRSSQTGEETLQDHPQQSLTPSPKP